MTLVDHLMILVLFVVQPIHGAYAYRRYVARIESGMPPQVLQQYRVTMLVEWLALAALLIAWFSQARPVAELGIVTPGGTGFYAGLLLLLLLATYLVHTWQRASAAKPEERTKMAESFGSLRHFMPHDRRTYRTFVSLSVTAGVVEETLYRGFAFWYLGHFLPLWAVVGVSALVFGLGHSYQGSGGIVRVTLVGIVFGGYYLLTGSIWLPILAHALLDILQGATILEYLKDRRSENAAKASPAT